MLRTSICSRDRGRSELVALRGGRRARRRRDSQGRPDGAAAAGGPGHDRPALKRAADVVLSDIGLRGVAKEITFAESVAAREV